MRVPIRLRLTLAFALGMALVLSALGWFLYVRVGSELTKSIDLSLRARADVLASAVLQRPRSAIDDGEKLIDPDEAFAQILHPAGHVLDSTTAVAARPMLPASSLGALVGPTISVRRVTGVDDPARLLAVPAGSGAERVVVVVGATLGDRNEALRRLAIQLGVGGPIALVLASAAGWVVAGAALRPVERLRREGEAISVADLDRRLDVPNTGDEIARLATTLNAMLGRIASSVEREHRFVDDASHELRTPLAVLKAELDLASARPRSREELMAALRGASEETDRLARLAEDLLVLARARGGRLPLRPTEVNIRELLEQAAAPFRSRSGDVEIVVDAPDEAVHVDQARLRQAVENLIDNALRHGRGRWVRVSAVCPSGSLTVIVQDGGSGFPGAIIGRAFEPFAQLSANGAGGAGLGLTIVRAVAEAHGGTVTATNVEEGGSRVSLVLRM